MIDLGNRAEIPVIGARYAGDFSWWKATPLNHIAKTFLPIPKTLTERGWVTFLYNIRGYEPPATLFDDEFLKL